MSKLTDKLRAIAQDQICEQNELTILEAAAVLDKQEREAQMRSWEGAVDRQSGAFTQEEIDARETW